MDTPNLRCKQPTANYLTAPIPNCVFLAHRLPLFNTLYSHSHIHVALSFHHLGYANETIFLNAQVGVVLARPHQAQMPHTVPHCSKILATNPAAVHGNALTSLSSSPINFR